MYSYNIQIYSNDIANAKTTIILQLASYFTFSMHHFKNKLYMKIYHYVYILTELKIYEIINRYVLLYFENNCKKNRGGFDPLSS